MYLQSKLISSFRESWKSMVIFSRLLRRWSFFFSVYEKDYQKTKIIKKITQVQGTFRRREKKNIFLYTAKKNAFFVSGNHSDYRHEWTWWYMCLSDRIRANVCSSHFDDFVLTWTRLLPLDVSQRSVIEFQEAEVIFYPFLKRARGGKRKIVSV